MQCYQHKGLHRADSTVPSPALSHPIMNVNHLGQQAVIRSKRKRKHFNNLKVKGHKISKLNNHLISNIIR